MGQKKQTPAENTTTASSPLATSCARESRNSPAAASTDDVISIMVGDLQRIRLYPEKGFQIPQEIPEDVWAAYQALVQAGYNRHLIPA